jgi:hypothetical protein
MRPIEQCRARIRDLARASLSPITLGITQFDGAGGGGSGGGYSARCTHAVGKDTSGLELSGYAGAFL